MTVLAHTRDGVVVRGRDLYVRWAARLDDARPVIAFSMLPDDVRRAWDELAAEVQEVIARA